jgi:hypothetical protein
MNKRLANNTTDEVYAVMIQLIKVMHLFKSFCQAFRSGDLIAMDELYTKFIPICRWFDVNSSDANFTDFVLDDSQTDIGSKVSTMLPKSARNRGVTGLFNNFQRKEGSMISDGFNRLVIAKLEEHPGFRKALRINMTLWNNWL